MSLLPRRPAILLLAAACLAAGEAAPVVSLTMPDMARTRARLATGPFRTLWDLPSTKHLRAALPANEVDPLWWQLGERVLEARCEMRLGTKPADGPQVRIALRLPDGPLPAIAGSQRAGAWWLLGSQAVTAPPPATPGEASADLRLVVDLLAAGDGMEPAKRSAYEAVLKLFGLTRIEMLATATAQGFRDDVRLPGCTLPLRPIDPAACAGLPANLVSLQVAGIDGGALVRLVRGLLAAEPDGWKQADADCRSEYGIDLAALLAAGDGTILVATTPGAPIPGITCTIPATPAGDALVTALLEKALPGQAAGLVQQARQLAVPLPATGGGMPILFQLRRSRTRWIVSSDLMLIETLGADAPAIAPAPAWTPPAGALAHSYIDNRTYLQLLAGSIGMALRAPGRQAPEQAAITAAIQQSLATAATLMPPSTLSVTREGAGLRAAGDNNIIGPAPIAAGMLLPAIILVRESARKAAAASNMRQLTMAMIVYGTENDGTWPKSIDAAMAFADGDLAPKHLQYPGHEDIAAPFLYVRPHAAAKATQPVLISDPACLKGKGSLVCYADGHIGNVAGTALWEEGKRLAALPEAAAAGIETATWNAVIDTLTGVRRVRP